MAVGFFISATAMEAESIPVFGVSAMNLGAPLSTEPSADDILASSNVVVLDHFYRAGGAGPARAVTQCRVAYNNDALFAVLQCAESNTAFPSIRHGTNWFGQLSSPSEQDSTFPDKVDLFVQPDMNLPECYQFAVTRDGLGFGCRRKFQFNLDESDEGGEEKAPLTEKPNNFAAKVSQTTNGWTVFLHIPWQTLGGKPRSAFGLLPLRTRWRDGEVCSPVAFDFTERPPFDLFIETHFGNAPFQQIAWSTLCALPSGALRWQQPALLKYPDTATVEQIWQLQKSLRTPTDKINLRERLRLVRQWIDLLVLEGLNFRPISGSIATEDLRLFRVRREINAALRSGKMEQACRLLDRYLGRLDKLSTRWFADGSPGDIQSERWVPVTNVNNIDITGNAVILHCLAGGRGVPLRLSLSDANGIRICGEREGFFKPSGELPVNVTTAPDSWTVTAPNSKVVISRGTFNLSLWNAAGHPVVQFGAGAIAFLFNAADGIIGVDCRLPLGPNEVIYGLGERYDRLNQNGHVVTLWGMDDWYGNTVGLMNETYKPIPLLHSSKDYVIFDNSSYRLRVDIGQTHPDELRLTQAGAVFDYFIWTGAPEAALRAYTGLTGKPILPPKWAFEPWAGRTGRGWAHTRLRNPVAEAESVMNRFQELDIPHSAIYAEGNGADSPALHEFMAAKGIKVLSWYFPEISQQRQAALMPEFKDAGLPILRTPDQKETDALSYVDFTNPNALELSRRWWNRRLTLGVAGSMVDFGDRVPENALFHDGRRGDEMHNAYAYDYHKTYSEAFRERRGDDFILFGRAAAPGTQKFVAQFGGDHPANFAGLQSVLTGALNLSSCGFSIWGSDLGGFLGWPEPAVYMRWTQFGCFSPLMRCHGRTPREPWNFGEAAVANYRRYAWVRENLLNYIYDSAKSSHETGLPMMRPLAVAFPNEPDLADVADEYLFGADLLVAPVVTDNDSRTIHFPAGQWTSLWDGKTVAGPVSVNTFVRPDEIPVFLCQGAVIPAVLNPDLQLGDSMGGDRVNVVMATPPGSGRFHLTVPNTPKTDDLLIYGVVDATVEIDGQAAATPDLLRKDPALHRLIINLPPNSAANREIDITPAD